MFTNSSLADQAAYRRAVLARLGATDTAEWITWPTATAVLDLEQGTLHIAIDPEPAVDDLEAVCALLELSGYDNGLAGPFTSDPGEPDISDGLETWSLEIPVPALP